MKGSVFLHALFFSTIVFALSLRAEILIVKQQNGQYVPLDDEDIKKHGAQIDAIILKYAWPMCTALPLSREEQKELFAPTTNAEERFIQKKLQELDKRYYGAFIPTVLYELFCFYQLASQGEQKGTIVNMVLKELRNPTKYMRAFSKVDEFYRIDLGSKIFMQLDKWKLAGNGYDIGAIKKEIYGSYQDANAFFFETNAVTGASIFTSFNRDFAIKLINKYPELAHAKDIGHFSDIIRARISIPGGVKEFLDIFTLPESHEGIQAIWVSKRFLFTVRTDPKLEKSHEIIRNTAHLEYEARNTNRGLLFRTTGLVTGQTQINRQGTLLGGPKGPGAISGAIVPCEQDVSGYSTSFGVTLFAGMLYDRDACVYYIQEDRGDTNLIYAVLIDKQAYYKNHINGLFFIPPLWPLAGILQQGEFFHARATAAGEATSGFGMSAKNVTDDPTGLFVTKKNPLRHAQHFSNYLACNGRIVYASDAVLKDAGVTHDAALMDLLSNNQEKAAVFYGGMCSLRSLVRKRTDANYPAERMQKIGERARAKGPIKQ